MSTETLDKHPSKRQSVTGRRSWLQNTKRAHRKPATRPGNSVEASHNDELTMQSQTRPADKLPDPWLFDSEALIRELDRCRETVLQIPITNPNATHFGIQLAVNAIYNLTENLRYLLHLHRDAQRQIRKQHMSELQQQLSRNASDSDQRKKVVPIVQRARKVASISGRTGPAHTLPRAEPASPYRLRGERS